MSFYASQKLSHKLFVWGFLVMHQSYHGLLYFIALSYKTTYKRNQSTIASAGNKIQLLIALSPISQGIKIATSRNVSFSTRGNNISENECNSRTIQMNGKHSV